MKVDDFGTVDVFTGATDMGQGADTVIAQMVAEEMGVLPEDVNILDRDTDVCPWDVGAHASRTTFVAGNSAVMAARKVKERILDYRRGICGPVERQGREQARDQAGLPTPRTS